MRPAHPPSTPRPALPTDTKQIEFKAVQTYSNGEVIRWIESTPKGGPEPELPAPVLKLVGTARSH